jgi:hypothetical protein
MPIKPALGRKLESRTFGPGMASGCCLSEGGSRSVGRLLS